MSKLTYVSNGMDWEALYVDGELVKDGHLDRLWPRDAFKIIERNEITETEKLTISPDPTSPWPQTVEEAKERQ